MKVKNISDIVALKLNKSDDIPLKESLILEAISIRASLLKQRLDKNNGVISRYLRVLEIPIVKEENCYYSKEPINDFIQITDAKSFHRVEILGDNNCCIASNIDEFDTSRVEFLSKKFVNNKKFYTLFNRKIKLGNVDDNAKRLRVYYYPTSEYEYEELLNKYNENIDRECLNIEDVEIEDDFYDTILNIIYRSYNIYNSLNDGQIPVNEPK